MKKVPPSSSTTFDPNVCNPKSSSSGCLTGVFRRLLCFTNLKPPQTQHDDTKKTQETIQPSETPGIVARLMGLDSMPHNKNPSSITRSKSMNYADNLRGIELESMQEKHKHMHKHRRVKSSTLLLHDTPPSYVELENDKFFILSFEKKDKRRNENKRRENVHENDKENREGKNVNRVLRDSSNVHGPTKNLNVVSESVKQSKPVYRKSNCERVKSRRRRRRKENCSPVKKVETECDSENSSPVSVLDFVASPIDVEVDSPEDKSRLTSLNLRRKLSEKLEIYNNPSPCNLNSSIIDDWEVKGIEGKCVGPNKKDDKNQNYAELWGRISKLAQTDVMQCNWIYREMYNFEDSQEIVADFGFKILDQLLFELVDQLTAT